MNKNRTYPTYFVFGALLLYVVLYMLPSVIGLGYSFTDWSVYSEEIHFVGWKNFATVFSADYNYTRMLENTLVFTAVTTLAKNVIGLALEVEVAIRGSAACRAAIGLTIVHADGFFIGFVIVSHCDAFPCALIFIIRRHYGGVACVR